MRILFLIPLLALAACGTPRERCESDAAAPYRAALQERARIAEDLARGYVFQTRFEQRRTFGWCGLPSGGFYQCWETDTQPVTRRVPLDTAVAQARMSELNTTLPFLRTAAEADTGQCQALYPAETLAEKPAETPAGTPKG
ncbi:hypothetical protein P775_21475 [Puniceibacterium antarcticum]|uniref:Uncharacterized protein n=1 Tax=Puniceibacterium antarcticum TaxID=1206336 RepID=A0A2G8R9A4_9RHOB|nr:excinuclease ABC subunit B [Puniceibacterium antarcticum]PIL18140.1 hypothetical protein P775_21475 [Puniceibacterium antarcticum]